MQMHQWSLLLAKPCFAHSRQDLLLLRGVLPPDCHTFHIFSLMDFNNPQIRVFKMFKEEVVVEIIFD
jgi:hypothetical protein